MEIRKISDTITNVGDAVRIEVGPVRRHAVATEELLNDETTARHYQVGAPDAMGKPIVLGEEMDFIDWKSRERAWYVYQLDDDGIWALQGAHPAEDAALSAAVTLAATA